MSGTGRSHRRQTPRPHLQQGRAHQGLRPKGVDRATAGAAGRENRCQASVAGSLPRQTPAPAEVLGATLTGTGPLAPLRQQLSGASLGLRAQCLWILSTLGSGGRASEAGGLSDGIGGRPTNGAGGRAQSARALLPSHRRLALGGAEGGLYNGSFTPSLRTACSRRLHGSEGCSPDPSRTFLR